MAPKGAFLSEAGKTSEAVPKAGFFKMSEDGPKGGISERSGQNK